MNDEIRKLLAGYATNSLTEAERKTLFEAALNDQELFDELHAEQAVKDVLDDPVSREQVLHALVQPEPAQVRHAWWTRWWAWTAAASAVAAALVIVTVTRQHQMETKQLIASVETAKKSNPAVEESRRESTLKPEPPTTLSVPKRARPSAARDSNGLTAPLAAKDTRVVREEQPPALPPPEPSLQAAQQQVQVTAAAPAPPAAAAGRAGDLETQTQQAQNQVVNSLRDQRQSQPSQAVVSGVLARTFSGSAVSPLSYRLLKRDDAGAYQPLPANAELKAGDAVRVLVTPAFAGYLSLLRQEASGEWQRVYPESGPGMFVAANENYTVPTTSIEVSGTTQKLRLSLVPSSSRADSPKAKAATLKKEATNAPLFVDIDLAPTKPENR